MPQLENENSTLLLSPPLVRLMGIEQISIGDPAGGNSLAMDAHTLLIFTEGCGAMDMDGSRYLASRGKCFLLEPNKTLNIHKDTPAPLRYYRISYSVIQDEAGVFNTNRELAYEPFPQLEDRVHEILRDSGENDPLGSFHNHIRFQTLLYEVLRRLPLQREGPEDPRQAVERTIAYLHRSFHEDIEVGRLAQEANMSRWQYGSLFKTLTGQTPNHYLNSLRIEQAKNLLTSSSAKVNEIAGRVGFRDEYYFSRRFKQTTGMSPTQFAHGRGLSPRIFSIQYLGELLALGIRPVGTNQAMLHAFPEALSDIRGIDEPLDVQQLFELKPDLILYPSFIPSRLVQELSRIATAVEVDWDSDVYTRLQELGVMLGRTKEASEWIERYKNKAEQTRNKLRDSIGHGETASAFIYHADGLYVYGGHHFGHTLYQGIGFEPPANIQALIDGNKNAKWKPIQLEAISEYAGDRVFIALADSGSDALKGRQVLEHPAWKSLPAVRKGRSYVVKDRWASYNPVTLEKHLDEMVSCLLPGR
ncbi:AraC family transcriptional regulator [Cohnella cholangitidis]|nr:AraC family transcriptional regulator [Cohnella cholangitidis]